MNKTVAEAYPLIRVVNTITVYLLLQYYVQYYLYKTVTILFYISSIMYSIICIKL